MSNISDLLGKTMRRVEHRKDIPNTGDEIIFTEVTGREFVFYYEPN